MDQEVARAGYGTTSEYFRQLIREDQQRRLRDEVDAKLLSALDNGESVVLTPEWAEERRRELASRIAARQAKQ
ncbi:MAG TPA: type II toxin-antitoxin system ParD family antitoxin [Phycisphaerae bacterium]|nr:type II toxin-antitoxin system ParD family antitoxin [Phycisphaerales bacterium]HRX83863.1 type II toxin-antitoxin system ParD family antitoxin [Phycisphaerae bacterium]